MAKTIQLQYEALEQLAIQIQQQAEQFGTLVQKVQSQIECLAVSWLGMGATAFQREMEEVVLPCLKRLVAALEACSLVLQQISKIFQEADGEATSLLHTGEGESAGGESGGGSDSGGTGEGSESGGSGGGMNQGVSRGRYPRPSLSGGGGGGAGEARSPVWRVTEPLRLDQGMISQDKLVEMQQTHPSQADRIYKQIVAMDAQKGSQIGVKVRGVEFKVDLGSGVHATIEGMKGKFSERTLDNLWNTLADNRHVNVTVPSLSREAEDQLEKLLGLAREKIDPDVFIIVRETLHQ